MTLGRWLACCMIGTGFLSFAAAAGAWFFEARAQAETQRQARAAFVADVERQVRQWLQTQQHRLEQAVEERRRGLKSLAEQLAAATERNASPAEPTTIALPPAFARPIRDEATARLLRQLGPAVNSIGRDNALHPRAIDRFRERLAAGYTKVHEGDSARLAAPALDAHAVALQYFYFDCAKRPGRASGPPDRSRYTAIRQQVDPILCEWRRTWKLDSLLVIDPASSRIVYAASDDLEIGRLLGTAPAVIGGIQSCLTQAGDHATVLPVMANAAENRQQRPFFALAVAGSDHLSTATTNERTTLPAHPTAMLVFALSGPALQAFQWQAVDAAGLLAAFRRAHQIPAADLALVDADGKPFPGHGPASEAFDEATRLAFRNVLANRHSRIVPTSDRRSTFGILVQPSAGPAGACSWALIQRLPYDLVANALEAPPMLAGSVYLVDADRQVRWSKTDRSVRSQSSEFAGAGRNSDARILLPFDAMPRKSLARTGPIVDVGAGDSGEPLLTAAVSIDLFGASWDLWLRSDLAGLPAARITAQRGTDHWAVWAGGSAAVVGLGVTLLALYASGRISRPIEMAAALLAQSAEDFDFSRRSGVTRWDASGLAAHLDALFSRLGRFCAEVWQQQAVRAQTDADWASRAADLAGDVEIAIRDAEQLESRTQGLAENARHSIAQASALRQTLAETFAAVEKLDAESRLAETDSDVLLATADSLAVRLADEARGSANLVESLNQSLAAARAASERTRAAGAGIADLQATSTSIGPVVGLIADIADRTRLLALNAAIEAANAGEAGRGFAVVAGEVKTLARQAASAAEHIGQQVSNLRRQADAARSALRTDGDEVYPALERTIESLQGHARSAKISEQLGGELLEQARQLGVRLAGLGGAVATTGRRLAEARTTTTQTTAHPAARADNLTECEASTANALRRLTDVRTKADALAQALCKRTTSALGDSRQRALPAPSRRTLTRNDRPNGTLRPRQIAPAPYVSRVSSNVSNSGRSFT